MGLIDYYPSNWSAPINDVMFCHDVVLGPPINIAPNRIVQTITPGSGTAHYIILPVAVYPAGFDPDVSVILGIYAVDGSKKPTGTALATSSATFGQIAAGYAGKTYNQIAYQFDFDESWIVSAATTYAIVISLSAYGSGNLAWAGTTPGSYPNIGQTWGSDDGTNWVDFTSILGDAAFQLGFNDPEESPSINKVYLGAGGSFILCTTVTGLYLSSNFGSSWSQNFPDENEETEWDIGTCSGTGTYLIVKRPIDNVLYRSGNGGNSWGTITPAGGDTFSANATAMSEDGQFVVITGANSTTALNSCYLSTDYGVTWSATLPTPIPTTWTMCDISDDGEIIGAGRTGTFFVSFDGGASWQLQFPPSTNDWWEHVRISGDGKVGIVANSGSTNEVFKTSGWFNQITISETALTAYARSLIAAANSAEAATILGLGTGDSPAFTGLTVSGLTVSRLMATDGSKALESVSDLTVWITGTTNQVNTTDEGDGTITLSLPQDIHEGATPTIHGLVSTGDIELKAGQKLYFDGG